MKRGRYCLSVLVAGMLLPWTGPCRAQSTAAQVTGRVSDQTGAVVPEAAVTVVNVNTGIKSETKSNEAGDYTVPLLQPAIYRITVQKEGFKPRTQTGIELQVNQSARVDFALELGTLAEAVEVVGVAPLLAQQTSSLGQVVDNSKIVNMPLNGRSPFRLVLLTPGVSSTPAASGQFGDVAVNTNQDADFAINGGQAHSTEVHIDGVPSTAGLFNSITTIPSVDSTQEFKVESNNLSAEWGRFSGGVINVSSRSGTNALHGALYEFLRNSAFDSNEFFNNRAGQSKPPFRMNQVGFAAGGPLLLGRVYNGRNRTFFFGDYQATHWRRGEVFTTTLPIDAERSGNFTGTRNTAAQMIVAYDPVTTRPDPARAGQFLRDPFPGNVIPTARIDPVSRRVVEYYPKPNTSGNPITGVNNFISNASRTIDKDEFSGRIDHNVGSSWRMFGRLSRNYTDLGQPDTYGNPASGGSGNVGKSIFHYTTAAFDNTFLLGPTSFLSVRYGFARWFQNRPTRSYGFDQNEIGMPASLVRQYLIPVFPALTVEGYGGMAGNSYLVNGNDTHSVLPSWTKLAGRHDLKIGGDIRLRRINVIAVAGAGGSYTFNRVFTRGPDPNRFTADAGIGIASLLLGAAASGEVNIIAGESLQDWYTAAYIQDNIRVGSRLAVNVGLRYETESPYTERRDQLAYMDSALASPARNSQFPALVGGLRFANADGGSRHVYVWDRNNIAPRVGLAYTLTPSMVLRAGAGLFYAPLEISSTNTGTTLPSAGFSSSTPFAGSLDGGLTPFRYFRNPFPDGLAQPTRANLGAATNLGQSLDLWSNRPATPLAWQWNADVQQRLPGDLLSDIAYSANRGIRLTRGYSANELDPRYLALGTGLQRLVANPFAGLIPKGTLAQPQVAARQLLLPYPHYLGLNVMNDTSGSSTYHSMQLKVEKRMRRGSGFLLSYTAGKLISDTRKSVALFGSYNQTVAVQNWYDLRSERSISEMDVAQSLAVSYVIALPFGPGQPLLSAVKGPAAKLLGGWGISGIASYRSGFPLSLTAPNTGAGGGTRPNSTGRSARITTSRARGEKIDRWFDIGAFSAPAPFTFGNVGRTLPDVRGPSLINLDTALLKDTHLKEDLTLQFRAEAFNLTNTPQLWLPNTTFGNLQFGQISQTSGLPRVIQFSLKLIF